MDSLFELQLTTAAPGSRDVAGTLHRQLKTAILDGRLVGGSRLPATRKAPEVFGVSRNTTQQVYELLAQEGLVEARHGSGTYVAMALTAGSPSTAPGTAPRPATNPVWENGDLAAWLAFWRQDGSVAPPSGLGVDLRPAMVDAARFPHATFRQVMARELRRLEKARPSSASPQGNQGNFRLRSAIAHLVALSRAIAVRADDILVTAGAQQAFDLVARIMVRPGETVVAVEDPGYPPLRVPFAAAGARIVPVRVDGQGIVVEEIPPEASIICVCPSHQFPLGMPLSPARRHALLRFAERTGSVIVEDDYDGEFRHGGSPLEALWGDPGARARVFYIGSFSKSMFPSLRLGFVVAPDWAMPTLVRVKNATDWHCPVLTQLAVAGFIEGGHLTRHVARTRRLYRDRRRHLIALLAQHAAGRLRVVPSQYGMHSAALADENVDCERISDRLGARGIMIHGLRRYCLDPANAHGFVFGFGSVALPALDVAIDALGKELRLTGESC